MQFSVTRSSRISLAEYLAVRISFSAFTSSTAVSGPFGIALSLKCSQPPQKDCIIMAGPRGFEPKSSVLETDILPVELWAYIMSDTPLTWTIKAVWIHPPLWNITPLFTVLLEFNVSGR